MFSGASTACKADWTLPELPAKDVIQRISRDVRFSKSKIPYKTNLACASDLPSSGPLSTLVKLTRGCCICSFVLAYRKKRSLGTLLRPDCCKSPLVRIVNQLFVLKMWVAAERSQHDRSWYVEPRE